MNILQRCTKVYIAGHILYRCRKVYTAGHINTMEGWQSV
jgi:hypothetical protein